MPYISDDTWLPSRAATHLDGDDLRSELDQLQRLLTHGRHAGLLRRCTRAAWAADRRRQILDTKACAIARVRPRFARYLPTGRAPASDPLREVAA